MSSSSKARPFRWPAVIPSIWLLLAIPAPVPVGHTDLWALPRDHCEALLEQAPLDPWQPDSISIQVSRLARALSDSNAVVLDCLLEEGADPNFAFNNGVTPLDLAIIAQCADCVSSLLASGADPLKPGENGRPSIHRASDGPIRQLLLNHIGETAESLEKRAVQRLLTQRQQLLKIAKRLQESDVGLASDLQRVRLDSRQTIAPDVQFGLWRRYEHVLRLSSESIEHRPQWVDAFRKAGPRLLLLQVCEAPEKAYRVGHNDEGYCGPPSNIVPPLQRDSVYEVLLWFVQDDSRLRPAIEIKPHFIGFLLERIPSHWPLDLSVNGHFPASGSSDSYRPQLAVVGSPSSHAEADTAFANGGSVYTSIAPIHKDFDHRNVSDGLRWIITDVPLKSARCHPFRKIREIRLRSEGSGELALMLDVSCFLNPHGYGNQESPGVRVRGPYLPHLQAWSQDYEFAPKSLSMEASGNGGVFELRWPVRDLGYNRDALTSIQEIESIMAEVRTEPGVEWLRATDIELLRSGELHSLLLRGSLPASSGSDVAPEDLSIPLSSVAALICSDSGPPAGNLILHTDAQSSGFELLLRKPPAPLVRPV